MSRYGSNFYSDVGSALTYYGESSGSVFDTSPFTARPTNYGEITLKWTRPATGSTASRVRLIRNAYGHPESPVDGTILFDLSATASPTTWVDSALSEGIFYYYSLYATDNAGTWGFAGNAETYSTRRWGLADNLWFLIPSFMKTQYTFSDLGVENSVMQRWVSLYGFELDSIRTEVELLGKSHNPVYMKHSLIPLGLAQYGMTYEPSIGAANNRKLLRNAGKIVGKRGTTASVVNYISSITGWGVNLRIGSNMLLDHNDSSFQESIGNWSAQNRIILTRVLGDTSVSAYLEPLSPSNFPNSSLAYMSMVVPAVSGRAIGTGTTLTAQTSGSSKIAIGTGAALTPSTDGSGTGTPIAALPQVSQIKTRGIPVEVTTYYSANCRLRKVVGGTTRNITLSIVWYDASGTEISRTAGAATSVSSTSDWSTIAACGSTSPSSAVWAGLELSIASGAVGDAFLVDAVQFGKNLKDTFEFQDARLVDILLYPNRQNYIQTPCFRVGAIGNWTTNVGALNVINGDGVVAPKCLTTIAPATSPTYTTVSANIYSDEGSGPLTGWSSGLWDDGTWDDAAPVGGGGVFYPPASQVKTYTASAYVKLSGGTLTGSANVTISQVWIDGITNASTVSVPVGTWTRISVTSQNTGLGLYQVSIGVAGGTTQLMIDGIMMERTLFPLDYFDGNSKYSSNDDGMWFGTPYASESLVYINRLPKFIRLRSSLQKFLPEAADFRLTFAKLS